MDRADTAIEQWGRERPDLPTLPMALLDRLSEAAERVMRDHLNPLFTEAEQKILAALSTADQEKLNQLLKKLIAAL